MQFELVEKIASSQVSAWKFLAELVLDEKYMVCFYENIIYT